MSRMLPSVISCHAVWTLYVSGRHFCLSPKMPVSHKNLKWQRNDCYNEAKHQYMKNMLQPMSYTSIQRPFLRVENENYDC